MFEQSPFVATVANKWRAAALGDNTVLAEQGCGIRLIESDSGPEQFSNG
jgi:hypothetical protein